MDNNAINSTTNSIENGAINTTNSALTNENSNWVWSDEKLSYYDQSSGWYYREDLGYFYFDENNECHYVYPAETSAVNGTIATGVDGEQSYQTHHKKHKHKHKEKKEEEKEKEKDKQEGNDKKIEKEKNNCNSDSDSSELEEGEISEDDEEENSLQTSSTLLQPSNYINNNSYYNNSYYPNMNGVGMMNSTSSTFSTEIQLAYGLDANQSGVTNTIGPTELQQQQQQQAYEDEYMRLVVKSSGLYDKGSIVLIDAEGLSIGRDKSYEKRLRLPEMQVSKYHAKIYLEAEYQQVIPPPTETQPQPYDTTVAAMTYPAEQQSLYLNKKEGQKSKSHPKRKYEDLDHDYSDREENINYNYNMYDDDNDDNKSEHQQTNKNTNNTKDKEKEETTKSQSKKIKTTNTIKEDEPSIKDKINNNVIDKDKKENGNTAKKDLSVDENSKTPKNDKNTQEKQDQSNENNQKEDNKINSPSNNDNKEKEKTTEKEKEEEEEEEEEEGEITDDGEYIPIEEDKEEEKKDKEGKENVDDNFGYQENYDQSMAMNVNYEPQPQYTCTYHFSIIDMGSTHGTYVNGERLSESKICSKPCPLNNGDTIQIGSTILEVHYHKPWGACKDCTITENQKEIPLLDKNMMTQNTENTGYDPHPVSLEEQRKNELKRLKSKYLKRPAHSKKSKSSGYYGPGGEEEGESSNPYIDRAAQRRELYNTNIPYFK